MSVEIFNNTTGQIVDVPEESVDLYLANPAYRKVKAADRRYNPPPGVNTTQEPGPWTNAIKPADASEVPANQPTNTGEPSAEVPDAAVDGAEAEVEADADAPNRPVT